MKKTVLSLMLAVTIILSLSSPTMVMAEHSFVDAYDIEDLLNSEIQYDLNFDGKPDSIKINLYANYWGYWSLEINNNDILYSIVRHGSYEKAFITDIDTSDSYLDIILIDRYKGLSADIFRFNGTDLLKSTNSYRVSQDTAASTLDMDISIMAGNSNITFLYGDERFEYENINSFEKINLGDNYKSIFNSYKDTLMNTEFSKYTLHDMDQDQIPELILSNDSKNSKCEIYTYIENEFIKIAEDTIDYGLYSSGLGGLLFETGGTDVTSFINKYIENGKLIESSTTFLSACYVHGSENFIFHGEEVSENEYNTHKPTEDERLQFMSKNDLSLLRNMLYQNEEEFKVVLNGEEIKFDQPPIHTPEGRLLVPIRRIAESMGKTVLYSEETKTAFVDNSNEALIIPLFEKTMYIANENEFNFWEKVELEVPAIEMNGRTLVPARAFCESLGATVSWKAEEKTAFITYDDSIASEQMNDMLFDSINSIWYMKRIEEPQTFTHKIFK